MKPRVLFVGPTWYRWPLPPADERRFAALAGQLDFRVLARGRGGDERFRLLPAGKAFHARLPIETRRAVRAFRPDAIVAEDPRAATLVPRGPRLVVEVHGNWRHVTRLYGSPARRLASPLVDALDRRGLRRADAVRAVSAYTAGLVEEVRGRPPEAVFPAYSDLTSFTARPVQPLPERPAALFVGVLEAYKNIEGLVAAWRIAAPQVPEARLVVVGKGRQAPLLAGVERLEHVPELPPEGVAKALDEASLLVLPSRYEGLGRVVIEAFARGRGVVASRTGGILDLVDDGAEGLLVDAEDAGVLAAALVRVLSDRGLAARLGESAHARFPEWNQSPEQWASRLRAVVETALH